MDVPSAEIVDADGEANDKEYRQRQQVRQVEIRRFRRHRFGGDGFQTASNRHQGRLKTKTKTGGASGQYSDSSFSGS